MEMVFEMPLPIITLSESARRLTLRPATWSPSAK